MSEPAATQTTTIGGTFGMQLDFGQGHADGYGVLGAIETKQGQYSSLTATPFDVSNFAPACSTADNPCTGTVTTCAPAQQPELRASNVGFTSAGIGTGLLELFGGRFRGSLPLRATVVSQVQSTCGSGLASTAADSNSLPLTLSFDGEFKISPALATDGRIRLGVIKVTDPSAQRSNFGKLQACTGVVTCDQLTYPLRLQVHTFSAEVLVGAGSPSLQ
jgi:hypothetical protein